LIELIREREVRVRANIWGMTCFALVGGVTVSLVAQGGPQTEKGTGQTIGVVGCISKSAAPAGGRGGSTGAPGASYMLTKVSPAAADVMPKSASENQTKPAIASQYRLSGPDSMVAPYDGHQVQITGTIDSSAPAGSGAAGVPTLKVDTVYVKSNSCP
jgi:hypothetical protein